MNKRIIRALAALISILMLASCHIDDDRPSAETSDTEEETSTTVETTNEITDDSTETETETESDTTFEKNETPEERFPVIRFEEDLRFYYPMYYFETGIISTIVEGGSKQVQEYTDELHKKHSYAEISQVPSVYWYIEGFSISKEDFVQENENRKVNNYHSYLDRDIEIFFDIKDIDLMKRELKQDTTFYFEGTLYNILDLKDLDDNTLLKMNKNGELLEYINNLRRPEVLEFFEDNVEFKDWFLPFFERVDALVK